MSLRASHALAITISYFPWHSRPLNGDALAIALLVIAVAPLR